MASAADVPGKYDVVINGQGYVFLDSVEPSLPFRTHRATYNISPTFVERQNVSNNYGDNAQDFFLTVRQRNWSQGEQQKFYRTGQDGRYWMGQNIDVTTSGQVTLAQSSPSLSFAAAVRASSKETGNAAAIVTASSTNLYRVAPTGAIADLGAHGLGTAPARFGMCSDFNNVYLSSTTGGTVGVRKWNGAAYSTFSATAADSLAFLNNTLYGYDNNASRLLQYDTAGTATAVFTWKDSTGLSGIANAPRVRAFGGKLLLAFPMAQESSELWAYDGSGAYRLEVFPENFFVNDMKILYGVAYVAGSFVRADPSTGNYLRPAVLFYDGSQIGKLWQANAYNTSNIADGSLIVGPHPALGVADGRLVWTDETTGNFMAYDPAVGGVSSVGTFTPNAGSDCVIASTGRFLVHTRNQTTGYYFPSGSCPSSGYVISSLIDFESSLSKQFRGVKIDFDAASNGDGGSVDIAYQIDSVSGAWTTLQAGAVSGTEYKLSNISGHAIAIRITLNKGTSTSGPVLKSMNLRAAPLLSQFRSGLYVLDCTNTAAVPRRLRDGTPHPVSGADQVQNLLTAAKTTQAFSITDRLGTFTGLVDLDDPEGFDVYEVHPANDIPAKSGSFVVRLKVREV